jgi:hypothetical protein
MSQVQHDPHFGGPIEIKTAPQVQGRGPRPLTLTASWVDERKEKWKPIVGFAYEVSNHGRVRRLPGMLGASRKLGHGSANGKILKARPNKRGHLRVCLSSEGVVKDFLVSRLVALAFVANPRCLPQVRHKDFIRSNNAASNLQWCSGQQNIERAHKHGLFGALVSPPRAKAMTIESAELAYELRAAGIPYQDIAALLGLSLSCVTNVCHGKTWKDPSRPSLARRRQEPRPF